jgi:uncharacterized membrane protein
VNRPAWTIVAVWVAIYTYRIVVGHYSLGTNAFDLSVFDYSIWSLAHGGNGFVPIYGYSLFGHHFGPFLFLFVPFYWAFEAAFGAAAPTPLFLLIVQVIGVAAAALLFLRFQARIGVERGLALALLGVFLFSRRMHGAMAGMFYPESFQMAFTFAAVASWARGGWRYWLPAVLLLMTKEDAPIYLGGAAVVAHFTPFRNTRQTIQTVSLAAVWLAFAFLVAIPAVRSSDAEALRNPIVENRFGTAERQVDVALVAGRLASHSVVRDALNLVGTTAGLSLAGLPWLLPAIPGIVINLGADPESMQASLIEHYVWPILPWIFMSAAAGTLWIARKYPSVARGWVAILVAITIFDSPALQRLVRTKVNADATVVREQLAALNGDVILAQPNLIPQLPHHTGVYATGGGDAQPPRPPDLVLLTEVGNLWPFTPEDVRQQIQKYESDASYEAVVKGPLWAFKKKN